MTEDKAYEPFEVDQHITANSTYYAGDMGSRFYIALRDKRKILGVRCPKCNKVYWPPRSTCGICFSKLSEMVEIGPCGTLETFTLVTYSEPVHPRKAPFIYGIVKLDGADTGMAHFIDEVDFSKIHIGMRVRPVFAKERKGNILDIQYFKPI
ncbi:MAG: Zn-ribbon domain-containing OB-fold protein [Thermodesulfobacteriota bacterium]|nr:Zn-ribbon domain-containing OB-fold protein [Thermodesulfobacteriota bacterium]